MYDADNPAAGFYRVRLRRGAVFAGVHIWFGPPHDPLTGEELDRSPRWQAQVNGRGAALEAVWPRCAADPIDAAEYRHFCRQQTWGEKNAPDSALADPTRRADPLTTPMMF